MAKPAHPAWTSWLGAAPPESGLKALDRWLKPTLWRGVGWREDQLWGEVRTKGSLHYKVCLDRKRHAFSCTCGGSTKPCVHIAALAFLFEEGLWRGDEPSVEPNWMESRLSSVSVAKPSLTSASGTSKGLLQLPPGRKEELKAGFDYLQRWLEDRTALGWRQVLEPDSAHSMEAAARLVDHRMPGPARMIRRMGGQEGTDPGPDPGLAFLVGSLHLACRVFDAGEQSPLWPALLLFCGMTIRKDSLKKQSPPVTDHWLILHAMETEENGLRGRHTWVRGSSTGRFALLLDFAWGNSPLPPIPRIGAPWKGELHFYPGPGNFRAVVGEAVQEVSEARIALPDSWVKDNELQSTYRSQDPWRSHQPSWVEGLRLMERGGKWVARDQEGRVVDLHLSQAARDEVRFLALSGTMSVFGLRAGSTLWPLSLVIEGQLITLPA